MKKLIFVFVLILALFTSSCTITGVNYETGEFCVWKKTQNCDVYVPLYTPIKMFLDVYS